MFVAPSMPINVTAISINSTSILIMWEQPDPPNGIIHYYRVTYTSAEPGAMSNTTNTTDNSTSVIINNLEPFTVYTVSVVGVTVDEGPPSNVVMIMTNESGKYSQCTTPLIITVN